MTEGLFSRFAQGFYVALWGRQGLQDPRRKPSWPMYRYRVVFTYMELAFRPRYIYFPGACAARAVAFLLQFKMVAL